MFLAMDTVFDQCSVAILDGSGKVISCQTETGKRQQTQQILPMIDAALSECQLRLADMQALIFNRGPGAFSGIRINTAVVQALSVAHDLPCVGVSSLQAIAQCAYQKHGLTQVYSALDARMQQVYFGRYVLQEQQLDDQLQGSQLENQLEASQFNNLIMQPVTNGDSAINNSDDTDGTERLLDYNSQTLLNIPIVGNGAAFLTLRDEQISHEYVWPDAVVIGQLGIVQFMTSGGTDAAQALPKYLRNQAWKTLKEQGKA
ncbi:tRNA (adenosine(37)-N6)-threonylcarbamoyltransferase complex dimerization subunit type 1 TsaB [Psychrobacter urativorans]|uniref:tRNA (adenosine(37)-N6)-threonylcarbamoyltransferase complex dimerization subunit type 1 TsaB n=1 Tax=Psychrobacter urativorans TaxID=45610 RepID=UPI00191A1DC0|nr:tRNA (adenosine(37)-N6)-threonylcarbamoyltransferase complex dimerization subunit type 1 TsaB [Psychrobacter urativorans]